MKISDEIYRTGVLKKTNYTFRHNFKSGIRLKYSKEIKIYIQRSQKIFTREECKEFNNEYYLNKFTFSCTFYIIFYIHIKDKLPIE